MEKEHTPYTNHAVEPISEVPTQIDHSEAQSAALNESHERATIGLAAMQEDLETVAITHSEEREVLRRFVATATHTAESMGISDEDWNLFSLCDAAKIDLTSISRDSPLNIALWVSWLKVTAEFLPKSDLRYQHLDEFLENYSNFAEYDTAEQLQLMHTANWMYYLFQKIPAKKNKGLAIQVAPKLVEGWNARYVTGSGQTKSTADRVRIYEVEGGIQPYQRVKVSKRKRPKKGKTPKRRKRVFTLKRRRAARSADDIDSKNKRQHVDRQSLPRVDEMEDEEGEELPFDLFDFAFDTPAAVDVHYQQQQQQQQEQYQRQLSHARNDMAESKYNPPRSAPRASGEMVYCDNDTSSESVDGVDDDWLDATSVEELMAMSKPEEKSAYTNTHKSFEIPSSHVPQVSHDDIASPKLVRLCSWGTTQPDPQIADHACTPYDLPAFPSLAQSSGLHHTNSRTMFSHPLNDDGADPFDDLLKNHFDFDAL